MRHLSISILTLALYLSAIATPTPTNNTHIPLTLFASLEELARIVDISYCVSTTGISRPFECASRCADFPSFELLGTFNTGPLLSDSCGFVVLDHGDGDEGRVIVAFRGTYSFVGTIVDLSTTPQEYVPYPGNGSLEKEGECANCTVHTGFWTSWQNTREFVLPHVKAVKEKYPGYRVELVGHSLGGAVAALAGLEFEALGWRTVVTTFGEPRVGNEGLRDYIDAVFGLPSEHLGGEKGELLSGRYRRVTHVDDPVPLLPLQEWGYRAHAGEIYISKPSLQPGLGDVRLCYGDEDVECIAGAEVDESWFEGTEDLEIEERIRMATSDEEIVMLQKRWGIPIPARYKMWQLFFAHRDYFWRLGLCVPGGDPLDWGRERYDLGDGDDEEGKIEL